MWHLSNPLNRREMLRASMAAAAASALPKALMGAETMPISAVASHRVSGLGASALGLQEEHYPFTLPALPYGTDALGAAVDTQTMEIHHGRHHQGYVNKLNAALDGHPELHSRTLTELVAGWDNPFPDPHRAGSRVG